MPLERAAVNNESTSLIGGILPNSSHKHKTFRDKVIFGLASAKSISCVVKYLINKLAKKCLDVSSSGQIRKIAVGFFIKSTALISEL